MPAALQIAVDAMSGDHGPSVCVPAALNVAKQFTDIGLILFTGGTVESTGARLTCAVISPHRCPPI